MRRSLLFWTLALVLNAGSAHAQATVRDALPEDAQAQFDNATQLYRANRLAEARTAFSSAYAASREPRVLFNVAVCEKGLGQFAHAIRTMERSLSELPPGKYGDYETLTRSAIEALRSRVAEVTFSSDVPGARYAVDGEPVEGEAALLDSGPHVLEARKEGFLTTSRSISVVAGRKERVVFALAPAPTPADNSGTQDAALAARKLGKIRVSSDNTKDAVRIDGRLAGLSGAEIELSAGEHRIDVSNADGLTKTVEIALRNGETREVHVSLGEKRGISPWWFVGGGAVLAGAAGVLVFAVTRPTKYEGANAGTLNPHIVPAGYRGAW